VLVLAALTALSGCGAGERKAEPSTSTSSATSRSRPAAPNPFPSDPGLAARATTARQRRELAQLSADVRRIRAATAAAPGKSLQGTPAVRAATTRFLNHEQRSTLDNLTKNRVIDHAAAAAAPACEQCFQQLEAVRPIVDVAH
jgi:hypothetical protein